MTFCHSSDRLLARRHSHALLAVVLLLGTATSLMAQVTPVRFMKSNQASKRMIGSAGSLTGRIHVYHIFATDRHTSWMQEEKDQVLQRMLEAYEFLRRQSRLHDHFVSFTQTVSRDVACPDPLPTSTFVNPRWTEDVIQAASGVDGRGLVERLRAENDVDNAVICLHINKPALSYNLAYYANVSPAFLAERMVCFSSYPDSRPTASATYAHEILHLFGAGDLYFPYDQGVSRKTIARKFFPNDVMFRVDYNLDRLNVGAFTAYRVGWIDKLDPAYKQFED